MKSIEINANGTKAQFSTKSLTIGDKEYLYTGIKNIKHSTAKHLYLFQYDGHWCKLEYEEKDEKKLKALFTKIAELSSQYAAATEKTAETETPAAVAAPASEPAPAIDSVPVEEPAPAVTPVAEPESNESGDANTDQASMPAPADGNDASEGINTAQAEEAYKAEENALAEEDAEIEKRSKKKKALIIFAIIIALFVIAGIIYFVVFGLSSNPTIGPNSQGTQQYNDIDELIQDLD